MPLDFSNQVNLVRLLINDTASDQVFYDEELQGFLDMEGGVVKLAAAQALDTIADDEALTSKVIRTQDLGTDGPKVADSLRKRAAGLRAQVVKADEDADEGFFGLVPMTGSHGAPELTEHHHFPGYLP